MQIKAISVHISAIAVQETFYKFFMIFRIDHYLIFQTLIIGAD
jgi:hypothetical protein